MGWGWLRSRHVWIATAVVTVVVALQLGRRRARHADRRTVPQALAVETEAAA